MEEQTTTTVSEVLSDTILTAIEVMDTNDVSSDEYKSARQTVVELTKLINEADRAAKDYEIRYYEVTKEPKEKLITKEFVIDILKLGVEVAGILIPVWLTLTKQYRSQIFLNDQMRKAYWFEQNGTVRSYPGKATYRLIEAQMRD